MCLVVETKAGRLGTLATLRRLWPLLVMRQGPGLDLMEGAIRGGSVREDSTCLCHVDIEATATANGAVVRKVTGGYRYDGPVVLRTPR